MDYKEYYLIQAGGGIPVFRGHSTPQRGYGLGGIFRNLFKWIVPIFKSHAVPLLKSGAQTLGSEAVKTVANIASDTINGKTFEDSTKERANEAYLNLKKKIKQDNHYINQFGSGLKTSVRKRKSKQSIINKKNNKISRRDKDIFDF